MPATKSGDDWAGSPASEMGSDPRGALAGFDCSEPRGALAGFELSSGTSDEGDAGLVSICLSSPDGSASDGLSRGSVARSGVPSEPMGALATLESQPAARTYFATDARSTSNSRAISRFRQ